MFNQDGFNPEKISTNFTAQSPSWGKIDKGTLVIKPEYANMSLEDMLAEQDLNFQVMRLQNSYYFPTTGQTLFSDSHSIVRADTGQELGYGFTEGYEPKSYIDILNDIFIDTKNLGGVPTRIIKFDKGARASIQFLMPDDYYVADRPHKTFFNLFAAHNGKVGIIANSADVCIVCGNTNALAMADKTLKSSFKHTASVGVRLAELRNIFTFIHDTSEEYYGFLNKAATVEVNSNEVESFLMAMIPDKKTENQGPANRRDELQDAINITVNESNKGPESTSAYDLFQGALRYSSYRTQKRNSEEQLDYVLNGPGATFNQNAYNWLQEAVK